MTVIQIVRESLSLLQRRDRWKLGLITVVQMATGLLDLIGVLLLGLVSVLSVAVISGGALPSQVQSLINFFGLENVDEVTLAAWLCVIAGIVLVTKTIATALLNRRTLRFLANRQAALSAQLTAGLLSRPLLEIQAKASQDVAFVLTLGTQAATVGILGGGGASGALANVELAFG